MKKFRTVAFAVGILLLFAATAWASSGGEHEGYNIWMNFLYRCVNFVIVVAIIWFAAGKKIKAFFGSRRDNIENELADLDKRKKDAQDKLQEVEQGIANMEQERATILAEYKAQGEALKASIIEKAKTQAAQITAQAKQTAEQETRYAIEGIRAELADLVVESAEKMLKDKLTKEEHEKLVEKYLTKVVFN